MPNHLADPAPPTTSTSVDLDRSQGPHLTEIAHPACGNADSKSHLENLPAEVRRHLLCMMDFDALGALVHASPVYYQQYRLDRKHILCQCLETMLRSVSLEACAVYRSSLVTFSDTRTPKALDDFLESIQEEYHLSCHHSIKGEMLSIDDISCMATFHSSIVTPLAREYVDWALGNLAKEPEISQSRINEPLSQTEETRVIRALYRFQLCCNLFAIGPHKTFLKPRPRFDSVQILQILESLYQPWEIEEIACINAFVEDKYKQIFEDISWDVNENNPKFDGQGPPTPRGAFDLTHQGDEYLEGTLSQGLELLHTALFKVQDHDQLVSTMQEHICMFGGSFLGDGAFGMGAQEDRRAEARSERDSKEERRDPLPFQGDRVPDMDGLYPPLAWTWIWGGTYSNLLGFWIGDDIHCWGYTMWDAARLEGLGAREVVARQIKARWGFGSNDPRDSMRYY